MDGDDPIGEILIGAAVMDAADEALTGFGRRYPRTLGVARIVCGAFLLVVGVFDGVLATVVLADVVYGGEGLTSLVLLIPIAFGVGLTVWGFGLMRRGYRRWKSGRSPESTHR